MSVQVQQDDNFFIVMIDFVEDFMCICLSVSLDVIVNSVSGNMFFSWVIMDGNIILGVNMLQLEVNQFGIYIFMVEDVNNNCWVQVGIVVIFDDLLLFVVVGIDMLFNCICL